MQAMARITVATQHLEQGLRELFEIVENLEGDEPLELTYPEQDRDEPEHSVYRFMSEYLNGKGKCAFCGDWYNLTRGGFAHHVNGHLNRGD